MTFDMPESLFRLLNEARPDFSDEEMIIQGYPGLVAKSVNLVFQEIRDALLSVLVTSQDNIEAAFCELCTRLASQHGDSCLSITAWPESPSNKLLIELAKTLYPQADHQELFSILCPQVTQQLTIEYQSLSHTHARDLNNYQAIVRVGPLRTVSLDFESLVIAGNLVFDLNEMLYSPASNAAQTSAQCSQSSVSESSMSQSNAVFLPLGVQIQLYKQITQQWPNLAKLIYQRNSTFYQLEQHIQVILGQSKTPGQAIHALIIELQISGEAITGERYARDRADVAFDAFLQYLALLPETFRNTVLGLETRMKDSLKSLIVLLHKGHCVETVAKKLNDILTNPDNQAVLRQHTKPTAEEPPQIVSCYATNRPVLLAVTDRNHLSLPVHYVEHNLRLLQVTTSHQLLDYLIQFPVSFYPSLLKSTPITMELLGSEEFMEIIKSGILNREQLSAFNHALIANSDRFHGLAGLFLLGSRYNTELVDLVLEPMSKQDIDALLQTDVMNSRVFFHISCKSSDSRFKFFVKRLAPLVNWKLLFSIPVDDVTHFFYRLLNFPALFETLINLVDDPTAWLGILENIHLYNLEETPTVFFPKKSLRLFVQHFPVDLVGYKLLEQDNEGRSFAREYGHSIKTMEIISPIIRNRCYANLFSLFKCRTSTDNPGPGSSSCQIL